MRSHHRASAASLSAVLVLTGGFIALGATSAAADGEVATTLTVDTGPDPWVPTGTAAHLTIGVNDAEGEGIASAEVDLTIAGVEVASVVTGDDGAVIATVPASVLTTPGQLQVEAAFAGVPGAWQPAQATARLNVHFRDVPPLTPAGTPRLFFDDIWWLAAQGVTLGWPDGTFQAEGPVQRQAMAAFLYRAAHPGAPKPTCSSAPFVDVPTSHQFCGEIAWLAGTGISTGWPDGTFRPELSIERQAMAAFLRRTRQGSTPAAACTTAPFTDVAKGHQFCSDIRWMASEGISTGYPDGSFRPDGPVERGAMAAFLHRYYGAALRTPAPGTVEVTAASVASVSGSPGWQSVTLRAGSHGPDVGGILVAPLSVANEDGSIGWVSSITTNPNGTRTYDLSPATLDEAYTALRLVATNNAQAPPAPTTAARTAPGTSPLAGSGAQAASPVDCSTSVGAGSASLAVSPSTPSFSFDLDKPGWGRGPKISADMWLPMAVGASWTNAISASCAFEVESPKIPVSTMPPLALQFAIGANGAISADAAAEVGGTITPHIGFTARLSGIDTSHGISRSLTTTGSPDLSTEVQVGVEASASILLGGFVGLQVSAGPFVRLTNHQDSKLHTRCLDLAAGVGVSGAITADIMGPDLEYDLGGYEHTTTFYRACKPVWTGTISHAATLTTHSTGYRDSPPETTYTTETRTTSGSIGYFLARDGEGDQALMRSDVGNESWVMSDWSRRLTIPYHEHPAYHELSFHPDALGSWYPEATWGDFPSAKPGEAATGTHTSGGVTYDMGVWGIPDYGANSGYHYPHLYTVFHDPWTTPPTSGLVDADVTMTIDQYCAQYDNYCDSFETHSWGWDRVDSSGSANFQMHLTLTEIAPFDP